MRDKDHILRRDLSPFLIHFCRSKDKFYEIIATRSIQPSSSKYTFNKSVICFTEAPIDCLIDFEVGAKCESKFWEKWTPYGFLIEKKFFHNEFNGLPVIYSPGTDRDKFKEIGQDWRLVLLNTTWNENMKDLPVEDKYSNYVWQREWRTQKTIPLSNKHIKLILPNEVEIEEFKRRHIETYHPECDCTCNYQHTLINGSDLLEEEKWETINRTCQESSKFPYVLIDLKLKQV